MSFSNGLVQPPASFVCMPACLPGDLVLLKHAISPPIFFVAQKKHINAANPHGPAFLEGLKENPEYNGEYLRERDVPKWC